MNTATTKALWEPTTLTPDLKARFMNIHAHLSALVIESDKRVTIELRKYPTYLVIEVIHFFNETNGSLCIYSESDTDAVIREKEVALAAFLKGERGAIPKEKEFDKYL